MTNRKSKQKPPIAQRSSPAPVSLGDWRKKFESSLRVGTLAWEGFRELLQQEQQSRVKLQLPKLNDIRSYVLRQIYEQTSFRPPDKNAPLLAKAFQKLIKQLDVVIKTISNAGEKVQTDGGLGLDLSSDLHFFHKARNSATATLELLQAKGPESLRRDAADQSLWFLSTLEDVVSESQANALAALALEAHGYLDIEVDDLHPRNVRSGKVRKRKKAFGELAEDTLTKVKSYALKS